MASGSPPVHQFSGEIANDDLDWFAKGSQLKNKAIPGSRHRANSLPNRPPNYCGTCRAAGACANTINVPPIREEDSTDEQQLGNGGSNSSNPLKSRIYSSTDNASSDTLPLLQRSATEIDSEPDQPGLQRTLSSPTSANRKSGWLHNLGQKFIGHKPPQPKSDQKERYQQSSFANNNAVQHSSPRPIPIRTNHIFGDYSSASPKSCSPSTGSLSGSYTTSHEDFNRACAECNKSPASSVTGFDIPRTGSFMSRLRRLSTRSPSLAEDTTTSPNKIILNKRLNTPKCDVPELENVLPPRVRFSSEVFEQDPPQQIPSRHPKTGNIIFKDNGDVVRTRPINANYILPANYRLAAHTACTSAHDTAVRIAQTVKNGGIAPIASKVKGKEAPVLSIEEEMKPTQEKTFLIDTPMTRKETDDDNMSVTSLEKEDNSLETIYTRCCHLREILPIPATLKQMKNKEAPLPSLRITNQKPTLIEVLSFADFISIVPVVILQFDNCWLSNEMLEILLSSICNSTSLLMLSLRNVVLDSIGWKILCAFLLKNRALSRLDISITSLKRKPTSTIDPMKFTRSDADWENFNRVLVFRNGIEELLINGCMVPNDSLELLLNEGLSKCTKRLGLALNDLHIENLEKIRDWMRRPKSVVEGLDLGGNDLNSCLRVLSEIVKIPSLNFLSLNSCDLDDSKELHDLFLQTAVESHLRFIDLSGNPRLFPAFIKTLAHILPKMIGLRRIHLDSEDFTSQDVAKLCESFARCPKLYHLSLLDNPKMDSTACAALSAAVQISSTLYTVELDSEQFPMEMRHRLAHYCILNMETLAGRMSESMRQQSFTLNFDDEKELMVTGTELAKAVSDILSDTKDDEDELHCRQVTDTMVKRARQVRVIVQKSLSDLVKKREKAELSTEEKEIFLRFCLLDITLDEVLGRYKKLVKETDDLNGNEDNTSASFSTSGEDSAIKPPPAITSHMLLVDRPSKEAGTPTHELKVSPMDEEGQHQTRISLSRNNSSSSLKKQEQEEGELLKLSSMLMRDKLQDETDKQEKPDSKINSTKFASGDELRQLYQKYKGDGTLNQLLDKLQEAYATDFHDVLDKVTSQSANQISDSHQVMEKVIEDLAQGLKKS